MTKSYFNHSLCVICSGAWLTWNNWGSPHAIFDELFVCGEPQLCAVVSASKHQQVLERDPIQVWGYFFVPHGPDSEHDSEPDSEPNHEIFILILTLTLTVNPI